MTTNNRRRYMHEHRESLVPICQGVAGRKSAQTCNQTYPEGPQSKANDPSGRRMMRRECTCPTMRRVRARPATTRDHKCRPPALVLTGVDSTTHGKERRVVLATETDEDACATHTVPRTPTVGWWWGGGCRRQPAHSPPTIDGHPRRHPHRRPWPTNDGSSGQQGQIAEARAASADEVGPQSSAPHCP